MIIFNKTESRTISGIKRLFREKDASSSVERICCLSSFRLIFESTDILFQYAGEDQLDGAKVDKWIYKTHRGKFVTNTYTFYSSGGTYLKVTILNIFFSLGAPVISYFDNHFTVRALALVGTIALVLVQTILHPFLFDPR